MHYLLIPFLGLPLLLAIWALCSRQTNVWKKWGPAMGSALLIYGGCLAANAYWQVKYGIPVLPTKADMELFASFCVLLAFVCVIMYIVFLFVMRKQFWRMNKLFLCTATGMFVFFAAVFLGMGPFLEKMKYVTVVEAAKEKWDLVQAENDNPVDLLLVYSERDCRRNCSGYPYDNLILARNQTDQPITLQLNIKLQNEKGQIVGDIQSLRLHLAARAIAEVWTEETNFDENPWERATVVTDERVTSLSYAYSIEN